MSDLVEQAEPKRVSIAVAVGQHDKWSSGRNPARSPASAALLDAIDKCKRHAACSKQSAGCCEGCAVVFLRQVTQCRQQRFQPLRIKLRETISRRLELAEA